MPWPVFDRERDAELREAFQRHLPQRLRTLMRRARAQCRSGWDINLMLSLHGEIAQLAGTCGRYGMLEIGARLLELETALAPFVASQRVPDADASARIDTLLDGLRPHLHRGEPTPVSEAASPAGRLQAIAGGAGGIQPAFESPPHGYWRRLGIADRAGDDDVPAAPPAGEAMPQVEPVLATRNGPAIRVVNDDDPLVHELVLRLDSQGCDVAMVDQLSGLVQLLKTTPPQLSVLVADQRTALESLGPALRTARRNASHRVALLVLLRDGDVNLRLRALRAGADRCIKLPATTQEVTATSLELVAVEDEAPYRILIVDDDAPQALFAEAILRKAGMETRVLGEALAVLDELDRFQPDLLLLDLNMPDCDGLELTALIREREGYVSMPIVFLSGDQDEDRQFAALDAGGDDFLSKPIRPMHLVAAVTNRVRRARAATWRNRRQHQRDPATGLNERAQVLDALAQHLAASGGYAARGGLLGIELHEALELRERIGLTAFELLLTQVGDFLVSQVASAEMIARYGPAGYLVFAPARNEEELVSLAGDLRAKVASERFGQQATPVQLDCGVCAFGAATSETGTALAATERALDAARRNADGIGVHSRLDETPGDVRRQIALALQTGSFHLVFQPVVPIRGAARPQYQALLRLRDDTGRVYAASELVPEATRAGLIGAIDEWVLARCLDILVLRDQEGMPVRLFVSQSLQGWRDEARRIVLSQHLQAAAVPAERLVLEFRYEESRAHLRTLVELAPALKALGPRLSLAGVDAEAITAGLIEHLPLDYVKLSANLRGADLAAVVHAAHARKLRVIAPCIEDVSAAERLGDAGADLLQGNFVRQPGTAMDHPFLALAS